MIDLKNPKLNEQLMQADAGRWAVACGIRLQAGKFTFHGREYQVEPMSSVSRRRCYMKATQFFGATEMEVLKDLHGMIKSKYLLGVAHIFPTNDEVGELEDYANMAGEILTDAIKSMGYIPRQIF